MVSKACFDFGSGASRLLGNVTGSSIESSLGSTSPDASGNFCFAHVLMKTSPLSLDISLKQRIVSRADVGTGKERFSELFWGIRESFSGNIRLVNDLSKQEDKPDVRRLAIQLRDRITSDSGSKELYAAVLVHARCLESVISQFELGNDINESIDHQVTFNLTLSENAFATATFTYETGSAGCCEYNAKYSMDYHEPLKSLEEMDSKLWPLLSFAISVPWLSAS